MTSEPAGAMRARRGGALAGEVAAPGDKSISHRALILGAMAEGETTATGLLEGHDVLRTAAGMRAFGAEIERDLTASGPLWRIRGRKWRDPQSSLYFGNSGTGCRLTLGAAAGQSIAAQFDGDLSLRGRPMDRIIDPLSRMGAKLRSESGKLPIMLGRSALHAIDYRLPVASAQVKSALLLAGLGATGTTKVTEPARSRDHTEHLLRAFGVDIGVTADGNGRVIALPGGQRLAATHLDIPGDPSSAAFLIAAAAIVPGSDILIRGVLVNPLRIGFYQTLREMGARLDFENARDVCGEPVADIRVRHAALKGVSVPAARAASMIDEYPILAVVAAFASGDTHMTGLDELKVKESDRLAAIEAGLAANGVSINSGPDWLCVHGTGDVPGGGVVETRFDHRIAMSFLVMGLAAERTIAIDDASMIATSFPEFFAIMRALGASIESQ